MGTTPITQAVRISKDEELDLAKDYYLQLTEELATAELDYAMVHENLATQDLTHVVRAALLARRSELRRKVSHLHAEVASYRTLCANLYIESLER